MIPPVLGEVAAEMEDEMWNLAGDMDRINRATLQKNGMTITPVSKDFRNELNTIGEKLRAAWAQKAGADAQKLLKEYKALAGR